MTKYLAKNKFKGGKVDFGSCFEGTALRDRTVTTAGAAGGVSPRGRKVNVISQPSPYPAQAPSQV